MLYKQKVLPLTDYFIQFPKEKKQNPLLVDYYSCPLNPGSKFYISIPLPKSFQIILLRSRLILPTEHLLAPAESIPALTQWRSLHGQRILRDMPAVVQLRVGPLMPHWSKVMTQTQRNTLVFLVEGSAWADDLTSSKYQSCYLN